MFPSGSGFRHELSYLLLSFFGYTFGTKYQSKFGTNIRNMITNYITIISISIYFTESKGQTFTFVIDILFTLVLFPDKCFFFQSTDKGTTFSDVIWCFISVYTPVVYFLDIQYLKSLKWKNLVRMTGLFYWDFLSTVTTDLKVLYPSLHPLNLSAPGVKRPIQGLWFWVEVGQPKSPQVSRTLKHPVSHFKE